MLNLNLQFFAHKKGVGSTKNGRDSESKRLGAKRADGQFVLSCCLRELISFYKLQIFGFGAFCNIETKQRKNGD